MSNNHLYLQLPADHTERTSLIYITSTVSAITYPLQRQKDEVELFLQHNNIIYS